MDAAATRLLLLVLSCSALLVRGALAAGGHQHHVHLRRLRLTSASQAAQHHHIHHRSHYLGLSRRRLLQTGNATTFCAAQVAGAPAPFNTTANNKTMVTCLEFHNGTALIKVPADTATTKYGQIVGNGPFALYDRDGKDYPIDASADPPTSADEVNQVWSHVVVEANLSAAGAVTSFRPLIYVLDSALLREYVGSQYVAKLTNDPPKGTSLPAGVAPTAWVRWSFLSNLTSNTSTALVGSFDNLYEAVQDGDVCRPALCADPLKSSPACVYYGKLFSPNVTLVWDARIFFPGISGSQLGAFLSLSATAVTYVPTSLPPLYSFLKPFTFSPKQFVDFNVGNPFNLPFQFSGDLVNATSFEYC